MLVGFRDHWDHVREEVLGTVLHDENRICLAHTPEVTFPAFLKTSACCTPPRKHPYSTVEDQS